MALSYTFSFLYPNVDGARFDERYYVEKHIPAAAEAWRKHGLKSQQVQKFSAAKDGSKPPYMMVSIFEFDSPDGWKAALADPSVAELGADLERFTNLQPVVLTGTRLS